MNKQQWTLVGGFGAGAGLMYLLDPTRGARRRRNLPPATRLLLGVAGGALCATALKRRAGRRAVDIHKTINLNAPVERVFQLWASFENFPFFMANVIDVRDHGNGRSHWMVRGPGGMRLEWDAVVTRFEPDRVIAWKTEPGSAVRSSGSVHFSPNDRGGTQIDLRMSYNPPAGALGHAAANLLGRDPKRERDEDEDIVRFKSLIEEGRATAKGMTVTREEIEAIAVCELLQP